jgi:hypothetical protein
MKVKLKMVVVVVVVVAEMMVVVLKVGGRSKNADNYPHPPLSYIPSQSTTPYTRTVKRGA